MLYHTAISHLFRPMLKIDLVNFKLRPRDACIKAANNVSDLFRQYRSIYPMRTCQLVLSHILLSSSIVHLNFLKDPVHASSSYRYLVEGLRGLEDLSVCHWFGARAFRIIYEAAKAWNLDFPEELRDSKLIPKSAPVIGISESSPLAPRVNTGFPTGVQPSTEYSPAPSPAHVGRRESLSMFARPKHQLPSHPATSQAGLLRSQTQHRGSLPHILPSYSPSTSTTPQSAVSATEAPQTTGPAESLFWNPLPNMAGLGVPIVPRNSYPVGPMDLDNMLGNGNEWDRFGRDGFKMSETWNHANSNAYAGGGEEGYPQVNGEDHGYTDAAVPQYDGGAHIGGHVSGVHTAGSQTFDSGWWPGQGNLDR